MKSHACLLYCVRKLAAVVLLYRNISVNMVLEEFEYMNAMKGVKGITSH